MKALKFSHAMKTPDKGKFGSNKSDERCNAKLLFLFMLLHMIVEFTLNPIHLIASGKGLLRCSPVRAK